MQYYILGVVVGVILLNVLYADIIFWERQESHERRR